MSLKTILVIAAFVIACIITFINLRGKKKCSRQESLEALARHLEGKLEPLAGVSNSSRISFVYNQHPFIYEDVLEGDLNAEEYGGYLKAKLETNFRMDFMERTKEFMFEHMGSIDEMSLSHWGKGKEMVVLPDSLKEFVVSTNNVEVANALLKDS